MHTVYMGKMQFLLTCLLCQLPVTVLPGGHAVVSLDSTIDNMMAFGVDILMMQDENGSVDETGIHGTKIAAKTLHQLRLESDDPNNTAFGFFTCWSDGFLTSYVCQKDNCVWILTISFIDPKGSSTSQFHTICLAIGHSKADHTEVIDYYLEEFRIIRREKLRYSSIKKKFIKTSFALIAYLGDLPERCSVLCTSLKGTFGRRIMYAYDPNPKNFPYCQNCFHHAINRVFGLVVGDLTCNSCLGWSCNSTSTSRLHPKTPNEYPTTTAEGAPPHPEHRSSNEVAIVPMYQFINLLNICNLLLIMPRIMRFIPVQAQTKGGNLRNLTHISAHVVLVIKQDRWYGYEYFKPGREQLICQMFRRVLGFGIAAWICHVLSLPYFIYFSME